MKISYSLLKERESRHQENGGTLIFPTPLGVFRVDSPDKLIRFAVSDNSAITIDLSDGVSLKFNIRIPSGSVLEINPDPKDERNAPPIPSSIYLPAQEFLSINKGFISAYTRRELPYDETYYDLALALNALPLREDKIDEEIREAITLLRKIIRDKQDGQKEVLSQQNGEFHFHLPEGDLDVHLVAEGYRKIATLYYLLRNGSLTKESILFWDEPEANLNPELIVKIAEVFFPKEACQ